MYTLNRLEWHLGDEMKENPAGYCVVLSYSDRGFCLHFNRLAVVLAKNQDHRASCGVFVFADRTPHDSKHPNRGGAEGKRSQYVARLGGSSRIIWSAGRIIKPRGVANASMMILFNRGEAPSLSTLRCGVGGSLGES